jgi:hypothetical protein
MFAGAMALVALPAAASTTMSGSTSSHAVKGIQLARVQCMTDEGGGRFKPCDSGYKAANPNWRASDSCMTDEGGGRYKPCSAGYKKKHSKSQ